MSKKSSPENFHYRMTHRGANYSKKDFWQPGCPLTVEDLQLLQQVKDFYEENGYSPCKADMPNGAVSDLKARFRTWKNVSIAAELPFWNQAELQQKRKENRIEA